MGAGGAPAPTGRQGRFCPESGEVPEGAPGRRLGWSRATVAPSPGSSRSPAGPRRSTEAEPEGGHAMRRVGGETFAGNGGAEAPARRRISTANIRRLCREQKKKLENEKIF